MKIIQKSVWWRCESIVDPTSINDDICPQGHSLVVMADLCRVQTNNNDCDLLVVYLEMLCSISNDSEQSGKTFLFLRLTEC